MTSSEAAADRIAFVTFTEAEAAIVAIRTRVFQDEQGVAPELEFDGRDGAADHMLAYADGQPVGTTRLRGLDETTVKFERLAVLPEVRGRGVGTRLMQAAIARSQSAGYRTAVVHAQSYVSGLYARLGFAVVGEEFTEAGIPHVKMVRSLRV